MLAVGAMAVSQDNVPKIEDQVFAVVNSYVREPSMRYGYRAAPSAGAYPYFYPRAYPYAAAYPYPQDYPAYHLAPSVDQYTMGNPYTNSYEFAYKRPTKNYAYTPYGKSWPVFNQFFQLCFAFILAAMVILCCYDDITKY